MVGWSERGGHTTKGEAKEWTLTHHSKCTYYSPAALIYNFERFKSSQSLRLKKDSKEMLQILARLQRWLLLEVELKWGYDPENSTDDLLPAANIYLFRKHMMPDWVDKELRFTMIYIPKNKAEIALSYEIRAPFSPPIPKSIPYSLLEVKWGSYSFITITHEAPARIEDIAADCAKEVLENRGIYSMRVRCTHRKNTEPEWCAKLPSVKKRKGEVV